MDAQALVGVAAGLSSSLVFHQFTRDVIGVQMVETVDRDQKPPSNAPKITLRHRRNAPQLRYLRFLPARDPRHPLRVLAGAVQTRMPVNGR